MTVKDEWECLRGEPIELLLPADQIPCIEESSTENLCKTPVVSVVMITYNHEPYIRQAIDGVMMQKTDFEFELIIGEDCSRDKTREICFEYQKKYPGKIRVLWWHENVYKLGGNTRRCLGRCRGDFVAFCEGDDYWTDPLKLQKQVDVMRKHPNVGFCFTAVDRFIQEEGRRVPSTLDRRKTKEYWKPGVVTGREILARCYGFGTCTLLYRVSARKEAEDRYEIMNWKLSLGDGVLFCGLASVSDAYYDDEVMGVYRVHGGGVTSTNANRVYRDGALNRLYYLKFSALPMAKAPGILRSLLYFRGLIAFSMPDSKSRRAAIEAILSDASDPVSVEALFGVFAPLIFRFQWLLKFMIRYHIRKRQLSRMIFHW